MAEDNMSDSETPDQSGPEAGIMDLETILASITKREENLRKILNKLPFSIIVYDQNGIVQFANDAVTTYFGFKPEDIIGFSVEKTGLPNRLTDQCRSELERVIETKACVNSELELHDKLILECSMIPIIEEGKVVSVVAYGIDITQKKELEKKAQNTASYSLLNTILKEFIGEAFNNKIGAILGHLYFSNSYFEELRKTSARLSDSQAELDQLLGHTKGIFSLIRNIRQILPSHQQKIQAAKLRVYQQISSYQKTTEQILDKTQKIDDIIKSLRESVDTYKKYSNYVPHQMESVGNTDIGSLITGFTSNKGIKRYNGTVLPIPENITIEYDPSTGLSINEMPFVKGVEEVIQTALNETVINAVESYGGAPGKVTLSAMQCDSETLVVEIKDSGKGLDPEEQKILSFPFSRIVKSNSTGHLGLGGFILYQSVRACGGEVHFQSKKEDPQSKKGGYTRVQIYFKVGKK